MQSLIYVLVTLLVAALTSFGWIGNGADGHGYLHLGALLVGGALAGVCFRNIMEEIAEEKDDDHMRVRVI